MEKSELLKTWLKHKKAEDNAKKNRYKIEAEIISLYDVDFKETSKTFIEDDFKVNLKKNIVHKLDQEQWQSIREDIPTEWRPEKITFSLDVKGFEFIKINNSEIYQKISDCVTIKENKMSVKIEKI